MDNTFAQVETYLQELYKQGIERIESAIINTKIELPSIEK